MCVRTQSRGRRFVPLPKTLLAFRTLVVGGASTRADVLPGTPQARARAYLARTLS